MSVYQEFATDMERRQRRVLRQQFWFRARSELKRSHLLWVGIFAVLLTIPVLIALGLGLGLLK